jgi:hypothetical protein
MLNPIKLIKLLYFKYITWRYCSVGLEWGNKAEDLLFSAYNYTRSFIKLSNKLSSLEDEYVKFGHKKVPRIVWMDVNLYGTDYHSYLMIKSSNH